MSVIIQICITYFAQMLLGALLFGIIVAAVDLLFDSF